MLSSAFLKWIADLATVNRQARECTMVKCQFMFKVASIGDNLCTVNFTPNSEQKTILIASNWQEGEKASKAGQSHFNTGFIGNGYTKWGVYVRIFVQLATLLC